MSPISEYFQNNVTFGCGWNNMCEHMWTNIKSKPKRIPKQEILKQNKTGEHGTITLGGTHYFVILSEILVMQSQIFMGEVTESIQPGECCAAASLLNPPVSAIVIPGVVRLAGDKDCDCITKFCQLLQWFSRKISTWEMYVGRFEHMRGKRDVSSTHN